MGCTTSSTTRSHSPEPRTQPLLLPSAAAHFQVAPNSFIHLRRCDVSADYQFNEFIGEGGYAQVWKVMHKATGRIQAAKILHKAGIAAELMDDKQQLREFTLLSKLDHPNIVRVVGLYEDKLRYYVITEYCQGGELFALLARRKVFTEAEAGRIMGQLISAVAYCHERKVIHRDLKPENVLVEGDGSDLSVKIADFGSSAFMDPYGHLTDFCGSPYYVAPEVLSQCYNEKCDMWSLGILMYVLLTGKPPYKGHTDDSILHAVAKGALDLTGITEMEAEARDLVQKLLVKTVPERLSAEQALAHPWIRKYRESVIVESAILSSALALMRSYHHTAKLKEAILTYIATQIMSHSDLKELNIAFQGLDRNGDGKITSSELLNLYRVTLGEAAAQQEAAHLIANVDSNCNGVIDYFEFLKSCLDHKKHLSKAHLEAAFRSLDSDKSGTISAAELQAAMAGAGEYSDEVWGALISEGDKNGDGVLDLKEFSELILRRC